MVLRVQILVTSATLSLVAAWRLTSIRELLGPLALAVGLWLMLGATLATRGRRSAGEGSLEAWAVSPNSGFWVVPAATALRRLGRSHDRRPGQRHHDGVVRRVRPSDAPRRAHPPAALDHLGRSVADPRLGGRAGAPRDRSRPGLDGRRVDAGRTPAGVLRRRPLQRIGHPPPQPRRAALEHALRRWTWLAAVRVAYYLVVAVAAGLASSTPLAVVAVLSGLGAPSFQPIQLAVLYGYRSEVVVAAVRWGWLLAPLGLGVAALVR